MNHLNPDLIRDPWTNQEDVLLMNLHAEFGNKWSQIAACMPGRADNMIKNRWYSILSKKSPEELAALQSMPAPALEDTQIDTLRGWTPPSLGLISPTVQMISPFTMLSPYPKMSMFSPWVPETPKNEFLSPPRKKQSPPSLSENRAELVNLLVQQ
jgi:myb proto-oncogene protein